MYEKKTILTSQFIEIFFSKHNTNISNSWKSIITEKESCNIYILKNKVNNKTTTQGK